MKIELSKIKPSPNPIRKTWDETKLNDLRWSLMEEGQVEPIGVRPANDSAKRIADFGQNHSIDDLINFEVEVAKNPRWEIVWGHRRTEAARRAGWDEIEAVIVPADEVNNLIQAGIENLAGEDMTTDDKADWAKRLTDMGVSQKEISRRTGIDNTTISKWLIYRQEKELGVAMATPDRKGDTDYRKIVEIRQVLQDDLDAKKAVAQKVSEDKLSTEQTRAVAEAYRDAPTPEVRAQVLKAPIVSRDTAADILRRSISRVELDTGVKIQEERNEWQKEREERSVMQAWDFAVKEFLDMTKMYADLAGKVPTLIKFGKYSPEAARFAIRKIDNLIDLLKTCREELGGVK